MRALIVAFYVVLGLFLISTLIYIAQAKGTAQPGVQKELVEYQPEDHDYK